MNDRPEILLIRLTIAGIYHWPRLMFRIVKSAYNWWTSVSEDDFTHRLAPIGPATAAHGTVSNGLRKWPAVTHHSRFLRASYHFSTIIVFTQRRGKCTGHSWVWTQHSSGNSKQAYQQLSGCFSHTNSGCRTNSTQNKPDSCLSQHSSQPHLRHYRILRLYLWLTLSCFSRFWCISWYLLTPIYWVLKFCFG